MVLPQTGQISVLVRRPAREAWRPRALVLDPFCGKGSILAAANAAGLDAYGIDSNPMRCSISIEHRLKGDDGSGGGPVEECAVAQCDCDDPSRHCRAS